MLFKISLVIPSKPLNVILSKNDRYALRAVIKETIFGLLFKYKGKLFHRIDTRWEKEDRRKSFLGVARIVSYCPWDWLLERKRLVNREFIPAGALFTVKCLIRYGCNPLFVDVW